MKKYLQNKVLKFTAILLILISFVCILLLFYKKSSVEEIIKNPVKNLKIDKAFVINLDFKPERWRKTKENLLKIGLKESQIERFSATYGLQVKIYDYKNKEEFLYEDVKNNNKKLIYGNTYKIKCTDDFDFDYIYKDDPYFPEHKRHFTAGEIGCLCSHLRVLQEGLKRNYDNILIFEDDVAAVKSMNFQAELRKILKYLPEDFELLHLGSGEETIFRVFKNNQNFRPKNKKKQPINKMSDFYNLFQGNYALLFSKNGIKAFLEKSKKFKTLAADILYPKISIENDKTYLAKEDFFYPYINYSSTIDAKGGFYAIVIVDTEKNIANINKIKLMLKNTEFKNDLIIVKAKYLIQELSKIDKRKNIFIIKDNFNIAEDFGYFLHKYHNFKYIFNKYSTIFLYVNNFNERDVLFSSLTKTSNKYLACYKKIQLNTKNLDVSFIALNHSNNMRYIDYCKGSDDVNCIFKSLRTLREVCIYKI